MTRTSTASSVLSVATLALALAATGCVAGGDDGPTPHDGDAPLSDYEALMEGAPSNDELPDETKADEVLPTQFSDLVAFQSPVRSQGRRGVCSIFSTVALMEHLYILEGSLPEPDFSEQYLQWSAKFEVGRFPNTSGSNASVNLQAITDYGIPAEEAWPYEINQWGVSDDPECDGEDDQPTRCYTNGSPPEAAIDAHKYRLPYRRWLGTHSIKSHMFNQERGVVVGLTFFYQSWNHRRSELPVNNDNWRQGIVLYPNDVDKEKSLENRAGHSILLVGWDDELEVPIRDENGEVVTDDDGEPVTEKGFYIFKNSWGTGSFGVDNPHGDGYGFISQRYVREYGSAVVSDVPELEIPDESCDNGTDDDLDGAADCDDSDCTDEPVCREDVEVTTYASDASVAIPDNDLVGISSTIEVPDTVTIEALSVAVDIDHTYRGDLEVVLYRGEQAVVLHDRDGGGQDDVRETFSVTDFDGTDAAGAWRLVVRDHAPADTGTLERWQLEVLTAR